MEKLCGNCKHFVQHYVINSADNLIPIHYGTCAGKRITSHSRHYPLESACDRWETNEREQEKQSQSTEKRLKEIIKQLNELVQVMKLKK